MKAFLIFESISAGQVWEVKAETLDEALGKLKDLCGEESEDVALVDGISDCDQYHDGYQLIEESEVHDD